MCAQAFTRHAKDLGHRIQDFTRLEEDFAMSCDFGRVAFAPVGYSSLDVWRDLPCHKTVMHLGLPVTVSPWGLTNLFRVRWRWDDGEAGPRVAVP